MMQAEDKLLLSRLRDLEKQAERGHRPCFSRFLDPGQLRLFQTQMKPRLPFMVWGGYPDAERNMVGFFPAYQEPEAEAFPITAFRLSSSEELEHRAILGSLMGLGIERNLIGDIAKEEENQVLFICNTTGDYVSLELKKVGRAKVNVTETEAAALTILPKAFVPISGTVASLRLDCVLGLLTGASRSLVDEKIRRDEVKLNHVLCTKPAQILSEGDVLSVRRFGRAELSEIAGETKKGRIRITLKKYI